MTNTASSHRSDTPDARGVTDKTEPVPVTVGNACALHVNGRFMTRPMTGVDRVAYEMLRALHGNVGARVATTLVVPTVGDANTDLVGDIPVTRTGRLRGTAWEQMELPRAAGRGWLYSPCNVGPLFHRRQAVTIHDAQVWLSPEAYSRPFRAWYKALLPRLARRARVVTTVSEFSKAMLERYGVVPPGKAVVIHNGADHILRVAPAPDVLQRHGLAPGHYLLAIGSLSPHKNLKTAVEAAALRADRTLPLVIAGGSDARVFADAGLAGTDDVRFIGRVSDAELRALYDEATALVFPSLVEGFGLPPLEAMTCGCPVIAAEIPTVREVCGDAVLYADPRDATAWTRQMERVAGGPTLRQGLAEHGREQAAQFTWARAAEAFVSTIAQAERG